MLAVMIPGGIYAEQIDLFMVLGTALILVGNLLNLRPVRAGQ